MLNLLKISDDKLSQTTRLLKREFINRGWGAEVPTSGSSHIFISRPGGRAPMHIFNSAPPTTSFAAGLLANNKYAVYELLKQDAKIVQPETILINGKNPRAVENAEAFLDKFGAVVVKPVDGGHGNGVVVNIDTQEKLRAAIYQAAAGGRKSQQVLVQQMLDINSYDIRILCIDYKFVAAIHRVPASVAGDGQRSVGELVDLENSTFRGRAYHAKLAVIDADAARSYLGDSINYVPKVGEEVRVLGVANYGRGGKLIDVTDDIPSWMIEAAELAAKYCGLAVCGVDYLTDKIGKDIEKSQTAAYLIEVNKAPILSIHDEPMIGQGRGVVKKFVDYLDKIGDI
jgi:D-alanine-D-alanine ligase-like ATP-grasp enzyme